MDVTVTIVFFCDGEVDGDGDGNGHAFSNGDVGGLLMLMS